MSVTLPPRSQKDIAALLAVVASSDGSIATQETERLVTALRRGFGLKAGAALELIVRAIDEVPNDRDNSALLRQLDVTLDKAQKEDLVVMLLDVIAADGVKDAQEIGVFVEATSGLNISDRSLDRAYERYFSGKSRR
ncbi:MAG: TerB family tellurite resistance protein [Gammaproteobacteria bacterium]|nr:TerB family tellurite resistance protein [Gammaproteobacteria bacterium]MDH4315278.1 TerB family tellurite resistance protein [Gammaproteobacteria bacterium]MDH5213956.1 TerB family tellurite resistance protein [Gammaproteobacteria bacterium]MDH5499578.1 TerB family tellurite resistance protein [Gammaproteobacteria bacterium]